MNQDVYVVVSGMIPFAKPGSASPIPRWLRPPCWRR